MKRALAVTVTLVAACSGGGEAPAAASAAGGDACGPLRVVVDGKELTGLGPVFGVKLKKGTATVWHVEAADGEALTCEEVLRGGRSVRKNQNVVAADISSDRSYFTGVRHNARSLTSWKPGTLVRLGGPPPAKVGDPIAICVDTEAVKDVAKGLEIRGALRGTYCGEP
jgi:hypothetical protein